MSSEEEVDTRQQSDSNIDSSKQYAEEPVIPHQDDEEYVPQDTAGPESSKIKRLIEEENTGIEVAVKNPQRRGGNIGGFFVYDVEGQDKQGSFSAKRRYNDFHELRAKLVENWPGIFIPPLPEKKAVGNKSTDFVKDRSHWLDHFMKRCAKTSYIFYSEEMQIFLRSPSESVSKFLAGIKREAPSKMRDKYKAHFSKYCEKELSERVQSSVDHYFKNLSQTIKFFQDFRTIAKELNEKKQLNARAYALFIKNTVSDYKRKLKSEEQEKVVKMYKEFLEVNSKDEFKDFLTKLKELLSELEAFVQIRNDIKNNAAMTQDFRKKQTEINGDIAKYSSIDKEVISVGFFKKANKKDLIAQLNKDLVETTANLEALVDMRAIIYNLLNFLEFPRLVDLKRKTFALAICSFCEVRELVATNERQVLREIADHYQVYLPKPVTE